MFPHYQSIVTRGRNPIIYAPRKAQDRQKENERAVVARFVARLDELGPLPEASIAVQVRLLQEVKDVALHLDASTEAGAPSGYDRRVLYEETDRWSLAAIILRPGQHTHAHDHGGWGCAVTVQGIERDRRFVHDASGNLVLTGERDYPRGTGYVFDPTDVHQPVGVDPSRVTVSLHFLVHDTWGNRVAEFTGQHIEIAA
jgi:predicted metal-dependent enzyme (double-stranded beta helix superfamily)